MRYLRISVVGTPERRLTMTEWEILAKLYPDKDHSKKQAQAEKNAKAKKE